VNECKPLPPGFASLVAACLSRHPEVRPRTYCPPPHATHLNPRSLNYMTCYDVASDIWPPPGGRPSYMLPATTSTSNAFEPSFLVFNGIL